MAGRAVEVGTGYLTLAVEASGVAAGVGRAFNRVEGIGASTGRKTGQAFAKAFDSAKPVDIEDLTKKAAADQEKLVQATKRASKARADAARKVQIEEMKLNELRDSGKAKASQLATAEDRVKAAREKYVATSRKGVGDIRAFSAAVDKSSAELKEAQRAASGAADGAEKATGRFSKLGGRLKAAMSGNFKGAFKGVEGEADRSARKVEGEFDRAGRESGKRFGGGLLSGVKGLAVTAVATMGIGQAVRSVGDMIQSAGALEQSVGAIGSVFKENQAQVLEWSNSSATAVGLNKNEYNELATLIGAQLKNAGVAMDELAPKTNNLVTLGADLSSMFGGSTREAVEALSSALKGERDPIERYGVSLNQAKIDAEAAALGFEKVGNSFDQEAQSAATLSLIMKQTTDAHGNFAKEADTFAGKQQRMVAQWDNLKMRIGEMFLPVMSGAIGFITDKALPIVNEAVGGIRAFGQAFKDGSGDITSSGFAGFMEELGYKIRQVVDQGRRITDWLKETSPKWGPFAIGIGLVVTAYKLWTIAVALHEKALWGQAKAFIAANAPIVAIIAVIGLLVGAIIYAYKNHEGFRTLVQNVWAAIKTAVSAVVNWITGTAVPFIQKAINVAGAVFSWLYESVIKPVWTGIRMYIAIAAGIVVTILKGIGWVIEKTLAPIFRWLYDKVVKPVFDWVTAKIRTFSDWWGQKASPAIRSGLQWVGDKFRWLYDNVVRPVWDWIRDKIGAVWAWIRDKALRPMIDWVEKKVAPAFERAKDFIGKQWDKLKNLVREPVRFFVDTVYNDGLRPNVNKILDLVGLKDKHLPRMNMPKGFARGGVVPGYQSQKRDDHLVPLRGGEGILVPEATRALGKDWINNINHAANIGGVRAAEQYLGPGTGVYGGRPSFGNNLQREVFKTGILNVNPVGNLSGWLIDSAIRELDRATAVKVRKGHGNQFGGDYRNTVGVISGHYPDWWAGVYGGNLVRLNNRTTAHMGAAQKRLVTMHELGHALGLPHAHRGEGGNGAWSMMNYDNMYKHNSVTQADVQALAAIYGGGGKAGSGNPSVEEAGILSKVLSPVADLVKGIVKKITDKFEGSLIGDMIGGVGKMMGEGALSWITEKARAFGDFIDDMIDGGKRVFDGVASRAKVTAWMTEALMKKGLLSPLNLVSGVNRAMQESGGDPNAINNWDSNARAGNPSKGLMQTTGTTFNAYKEPGYGNIWDPVHNILASINYTLATYGSLRAGWDRAGGYSLPMSGKLYDTGGKLEPGFTPVFNHTGTAEAILTRPQWDAMFRIAESTDPNGGGVNFYGDITTADPDELFRRARYEEKKRRSLAW